jgi:hypothetical protein
MFRKGCLFYTSTLIQMALRFLRRNRKIKRCDPGGFMFHGNRKSGRENSELISLAAEFERLEDRRLLSASPILPALKDGPAQPSPALNVGPQHNAGPTQSTTTFGALETSDADAYTELNTLASADNVTLASNQTVDVTTFKSNTFYTVILTPATGVSITLASDSDGNPISAPSALAPGPAGTSSGGSFSTTTFSALQTSDLAAYTGLNTAATADGLTIAATQTVLVKTMGSVTTYSVDLNSAGQRAQFTVNAAGTLIASKTTTTFGALTDASVTAELTALATDLNLTAPTSSTTVYVDFSNGNTIYSVSLFKSAGRGQQLISVDTNGNPAGNMRIPFSALPSTVSSALTALASADSLTISSTQPVYVRTSRGVTTYTVDLTSGGETYLFTVNTAGTLVSSTVPLIFASITDTAVTAELTTLASALNLTAPTASSVVYVTTHSSGSTYSLTLTSSSGHGHPTTLTVDSSGNPIGNENIPFSALPTAISDGLTALATTYGATISSTQSVQVTTIKGVTTYTVALVSAGQRIILTVNTSGSPAT